MNLHYMWLTIILNIEIFLVIVKFSRNCNAFSNDELLALIICLWSFISSTRCKLVFVSASDLQICPPGLSCCSRDMELQLFEHSEKVYQQLFTNATEKYKEELVTATTELHGMLCIADIDVNLKLF